MKLPKILAHIANAVRKIYVCINVHCEVRLLYYSRIIRIEKPRLDSIFDIILHKFVYKERPRAFGLFLHSSNW